MNPPLAARRPITTCVSSRAAAAIPTLPITVSTPCSISAAYPVNPNLLGRYAFSWSLDQAEDYLAVVPNEDALEKFVKLHGLPIKVGG